MATRYVQRSSGLVGRAGLPNANSIRVDSDTDTLKFGTGASGTDEKEALDLSSTQTITGSKSFTADGAVQYAEIALTNAEIKALRATPKLLVAAPGAGKMIELLAALLILDAGSNALTETADNLDLRYVGKSSGVLATVESTGFIDQTTDQAIRARVAHDKLITKANSENLGIELFNNGDGEIAGNAANDATMRVKVWYTVLTTGW